MGKKDRKTYILTTKSRIMLATTAVFLLFIFLVFRLAYLQLVKHDYYSSLASSQQLRDTVVSAQRGTIYDTNMNILARSATVWTVALTPRSIPEENYDKISTFLSGKLDVPYDTVHSKCEETGYYSIVKRKVDKPVVDEIQEFMKREKVGGITFTEDTKRYYPYGSLASQVLGFVGTDNNGLYGLEAYYESYLAGISGRLLTAVNAQGANVYYEYETETEAEDGYSLVLTIDTEIQKHLEDALYQIYDEHNVSNYTCGIIMKVKTGEILGMAGYPDFDPNDPLTILDPDMASALEEITDEDAYLDALGKAQTEQWRNRAISDVYEPGSVFKVVTASAALETATFKTDDEFYCPGYYWVTPSIRMYCAHHNGHGHETFEDAVINSCNPAFIEIGTTMGAKTFFDYFRGFGLAERTGIDLPSEAEPIFYSDKNMGIVELASSSYGQSNAITPIQMITAVSAAVNGGYLVQPYMVKEILDSNGNVVKNNTTTVKRQVVSEETSRVMCGILEKVVEESNGANAYVAGFRLGGKSGTGEKLNSDGSEYVASMCVFAPADDPEIACLIMVDGAHSYSIYGGIIVAPVIGRVMSEVLPYLGVEAVYSEDELANVNVYIPNVMDYSLTSAYAAMQKKGLEYLVIGNGTEVINQYPAGGTSIPKGSTIILYTEETEPRMTAVPDLTGFSVSYIKALFSSLGLNLKINGSAASSAVAVSQSVAPGTEVQEGTLISVDFVITNVDD